MMDPDRRGPMGPGLRRELVNSTILTYAFVSFWVASSRLCRQWQQVGCCSLWVRPRPSLASPALPLSYLPFLDLSPLCHFSGDTSFHSDICPPPSIASSTPLYTSLYPSLLYARPLTSAGEHGKEEE